VQGTKRKKREGVWELRVYIGRDQITEHGRWWPVLTPPDEHVLA
jgi:hypothetical protein